MLKAWKTQPEMDIGNTIEYDVKSHQVKTTIVKCTKVHIKGVRFNRSYKNMLVWQAGIWCNKPNLNTRQTKIHERHTT